MVHPRLACAIVAGAALVATPDARADERLDRAVAEQLCTQRDPRCDWLATLSSLERATVLRGIAARGHEVEPSPWGKRIAKVHVYNEDVFAEKSRILRFFNLFHVTTKDYAIRQELVIGAGEVWDQERIEETARRLRDPLWSSVVTVLPVKSSEPGAVDMFVITRDVWSLRLNTKYTYQEGKLTDLTLALSENNFFGTRTVVAAAVDMDQASIAMGPLFIDKNLLGQKVELRARLDTIVNREELLDGDWKTEGSQSAVAVSKPLWSLASKWGTGLSFSHRYAIDRRFLSTAIRPLRCPVDGSDCAIFPTRMPDEPLEFDPATTPADELFGWEYRMRRWSAGTFAVRQLGGTQHKHQIQLSQSVSSIRPELRDFPGNPAQADAFRRAALPRSELTSEVGIAYGFFTPRYRTLRNVQSYELAEDVRFGPDFDVFYGVGLEAIGSDANYQRASASFGYTFPWCRDGFIRPSIGYSGRYQRDLRDDTSFVDQTASLTARFVSPTYWYARIVAQLQLATRWNKSQPTFFFLGSDDGLRGYSINEFAGERLVRGNLEVRSIPTPFWFMRAGGVLFYDAGAVPQTFRQLRDDVGGVFHHDVGVGLRFLIPQSNRELFRFDVAFPLNDGERTAAGSPKFAASFEQAF